MPSGGGDSGGAVVSQTSPISAFFAGQAQSQAAMAAASISASATEDAINSINKNYMASRAQVQPYVTEGVQSLDQLNQFLQLAPYNPGAAPTAPTKYTANDVADQISRSQINSYIQSNVQYLPTSTVTGGANKGIYPDGTIQVMPTYTDSNGNYITAPNSGFAANPKRAAGNLGLGMLGAESLTANPQAQADARNQLATELAAQKNATYDTQFQQYQTDLQNYNQNLAWYNQYTAEGPLTAQQITDKITNLPGYQAQLDQGLHAVTANAAGTGAMGSGALLKELSAYGQNTLSTFYNNELGQLASLAGMGASAASGAAQGLQNQGNATAGLQQGLGDTQANAYLASGNAIAQALLTAGTSHQIIGQSSSGGGLGGIGSALGGIGSILSALPSSRKIKNKVKGTRSKSLLKKMAALKVDRWAYKGDDQEHIGPYAEDFTKAFKVGDGKSIDLISYLGVLTGSIKELAKHAIKEERKLAS